MRLIPQFSALIELEAGNWEPGTGNWEPGTGNREMGTGNRELHN